MRKNNAGNRVSFYRMLMCVLLVTILILPTSAFAPIDLENDMGGTTSSAAGEALLYALSPDHLLPFIHDGYAPFVWVDVDITNCTIGKLYVYNKISQLTTEISELTVTTYASTKENLFFVTEQQEIFQTDYSGSSATLIYQATGGLIKRLCAFGNMLYFIEDNRHIVTLNTDTLTVRTVMTDENVRAIYMFDFDKLICYYNDDSIAYLNTTTGELTELENLYEANALTNAYTSIEQDNGETYSINANVVIDSSYNDVDFPLPEYPATLGYGWISSGDVEGDPFDTWYAGSNECDGFAKFAHDRFYHLYYVNRTSPSWQVGYSVTADHHGALPSDITNASFDPYHPSNSYKIVHLTSIDKAREFFEGLNKGAFVRLGKESDPTPYEGAHSIAFAGSYTGGVYVYEANQDRANGVGYRQWSYADYIDNYDHVLYYVNHTFPNTGIYESVTHHLKECVNCDGYLRQGHDIGYGTITALQHTASCSGCNYSNTTMHTFSGNVCIDCGYRKGGSSVIDSAGLLTVGIKE